MREFGISSKEASLASADFMSRVYGLLFAAMAFMTAMGAATFFFIPMSRGLYYTFMFGPLAILFLAMFTHSIPGLNLMLFLAFAVLDGGLLGFIAKVYAAAGLGIIFAQAALLTLLVFGGITAYIRVTKKDFSYMGTWLFWGLLLLLGASIAGFFFRSNTFHLILSIGGTAIFTLYVMYDTSRIMNASEGEIDPVSAAWMLFIDLVNLFLYILRLLTILSGEE